MIKSIVPAALITTVALSLAPAPAVAGKGGISAAGAVHILPVGSFKFAFGDESDSEGTALAYGIGGHIDYWVTDKISVGFAPRYILNVIPSDADEDADSATELDLNVRGAYNHPINPTMSAYGFAGLGYSVIMIPDNDDDNPAGLVIGVGGGVRKTLSGKMFVTGELGYQIGMQKISAEGGSVTLATSYLHLGVGIGSGF